jgi:putative aldouronate transport system permease protein
MKDIIVLLFILSISGILNAGFDQLWTMSNVTVRDVAEILDTAVMRYLTSGSLNTLSLGAAMGFFKAAVGLLLFVTANYVSRLLKQESLI